MAKMPAMLTTDLKMVLQLTVVTDSGIQKLNCMSHAVYALFYLFVSFGVLPAFSQAVTGLVPQHYAAF